MRPRAAETWIAGTYDPDLNITYWGVAQAKPWMRASRGRTGERNDLICEFDARVGHRHGQFEVVLQSCPG